MSTACPILICPCMPLRTLPPVEQDVLRRFFTEHVQGIDREHDKRWRRFIRDLWHAEPGEGFQLYRAEERGGPYHRMHRAFLSRLFDSQERYRDIKVLHEFLKFKCWFVKWEEGRTGRPIPRPRSTNFDECSEDEMREFHAKVVDLLHQPWVQRRFWPHLTPPMRQEMVDIVLANREDQR